MNIIGTVQRGHGHGGQTGAPTANLDVALAKNIARGLYSCTVLVEGRPYKGLLYYGYNSLTKKDCLEVHLLNFSGNLYGKTISITPGRHIRNEKKFSSTQELTKQIAADIAQNC